MSKNRQFIRGLGLPPKFPGNGPDVMRVDVIGEPRRIDGGRVVTVETDLEHTGKPYRWEEPTCNIYDDDGNRPFGY
jgi:hypothetical protein